MSEGTTPCPWQIAEGRQGRPQRFRVGERVWFQGREWTVEGAAAGNGGGAWCGCEGSESRGCSVPVMECESCGDCDYGDSEYASEIRAKCAREFADAIA